MAPYPYWDVKFIRQYNNDIIAYLWIDYDELKFDGYVLLEPDKYLEWVKMEKQGEKEPPEYYEDAELIIGESSVDEDIECKAGWGLDTGTRKIFVNPKYAGNLIPELIKDMLKRHKDEWIMAWAIFLSEKSPYWRAEKTGKVRKVGNSYVISVVGLEKGKKYRRLRPRYYENLLVIYLPHNS